MSVGVYCFDVMTSKNWISIAFNILTDKLNDVKEKTWQAKKTDENSINPYNKTVTQNCILYSSVTVVDFALFTRL